MLEIELTIVNRLGLHARAASKFVNCAKTFSSNVQLAHKGEKVDGKSIMSVMLLAAPVKSQIRLMVDGKDETLAYKTLVALINDGFGELDDPE